MSSSLSSKIRQSQKNHKIRAKGKGFTTQLKPRHPGLKLDIGKDFELASIVIVVTPRHAGDAFACQ